MSDASTLTFLDGSKKRSRASDLLVNPIRDFKRTKYNTLNHQGVVFGIDASDAEIARVSFLADEEMALNSTQIKTKSSTMEVTGMRKQRVEGRVFPAVKYVTAVSELPKQGIGTNATQHNLWLGCFNPVEIMNAQYAVNSTTSPLEEWSSHFSKVSVVDTTCIPVQWPTPQPLLDIVKQRSTFDRGYHFYNCEFVKIALEFENHKTDADMYIWAKIFYPGDERIRNFSGAMSDGSEVDSESFRDMKTTIGSYAVAAPGASFADINRLNNTKGMFKMVLGPNSSNGLPNIGRAMFKINTKKILNGIPNRIMSESATNLPGDIESVPHIVNNLIKTAKAGSLTNVPILAFFGCNIDSDTGAPNPIRQLELTVRGRAEYVVRLFGLEAHKEDTMSNPIA